MFSSEVTVLFVSIVMTLFAGARPEDLDELTFDELDEDDARDGGSW